MRRRWAVVAFSLLLATVSFAQEKTRLAIRSYRIANEHKILQEFVDLLAIPNVAADIVNIRRNAGLLIQMLQKRGVQTRLL